MKRLVISALAVVAATGLAGCEKPNPNVTIWSGTQSITAPALCWTDDQTASVETRGCAQEFLQGRASGDGLPELKLQAGNTLGISVDPVVTDFGWTTNAVADSSGQPRTLTQTYVRTTDTTLSKGSAVLEVTAKSQSANGVRGVWLFKLVQEN